MNKHNSINTLIAKLLTGEISEQEGDALLQEAEKDPSLKDKIEELMNEEDFVQRYQLYRSIDAEAAKQAFLAESASNPVTLIPIDEAATGGRLVWLRRIAAAAVIAIVLVAGWMYFDGREESKPAVITAELQQAMERVQHNGMNGATYIVGGKKMSVSNAQDAITEADQMGEGKSLFGDDAPTEGCLVTRKDKEFWMVLDDGTYVHLNYNTTLVYPNHFVGSERKVKLKGEAYFVVAADAKKRPFIVETEHGEVRDYGTEFNVCTNRQKGVTSVVLVKGKVGVTSKFGKEYLLKPGEKADLQMGRTPDINQVDVNLYISWNTGNFYFDGCSLAELMEVISHWYNVKVAFDSDAIRDMQFTGSIDKYEPMTPTLRAIEKVTGLKISVKNDNVIHIRR